MRYAVRTTPLLTLLGVLLISLSALHQGKADDANEIDDQVDEALTRFKTHIKGAENYLQQARGVLVLPEVKKTGLVVGGQWGQGALRVRGRSVAYYKMDVGSVGFQGGYQEMDFIFLFFTDAALEEFRKSDGWTVGAETGITFVNKSFGGSVDTLKSQNPVAGFMFGKKGLMGGSSLKGAKFTRFTPEP
jgi:lipid-binding SYLF domain-containing protein